MSKVVIYRAFAKDTFKVAAATVTTGWLPGQAFSLDSNGIYADIAVTDDTMFIGVDDDDELSAPPTGSLLTGIYGSGTKFDIDHSEEVAASSATRVYDTVSGNPESGTINDDLYINSVGKWTTTSTGSVKGKMWKKPAADNNYTLGVILRF
jgi:hypothetical protein